MESRSERGWERIGWGLGALIAMSILGSIITNQPQRAIGCFVESREGWDVEHPQEPTTEAQFRSAIERQTRCVPIDVIYVNRTPDIADDGMVVQPIGTRSWFSGGGRLTVLVEAAPGAGVVGCGEPIVDRGPDAASALLTCPSDEVRFPPELSES